LELKCIEPGIIAPNLIRKQAVTTCKLWTSWWVLLKTHKLYLGLHLVLKLEPFWVDGQDLLELKYIEPGLIVPNLTTCKLQTSLGGFLKTPNLGFHPLTKAVLVMNIY
jgi:hypothetical protein